MRLGIIFALLLALTATFGGSDARAHERGHPAAQHESAVADHQDGPAEPVIEAAKPGGLHPHSQGHEGHRAASHCVTAVGCAGVVSMIGDECAAVPGPQLVAAVQRFTRSDRPREIALPVEEQPPQRS